MILAWMPIGIGPHLTLLAAIALLGIPAALMQWVRLKKLTPGAQALLAWVGAVLPAILLAYPWF
jgi:hypothetical protein